MSVAVDVHLLSGKKASLEVEAAESAESVKRRAESILATGKRQTAELFRRSARRNRHYQRIKLYKAVMHELRMSPDMVVTALPTRLCRGNTITAQEQRQIRASLRAFASILSDGFVVTWSDPRYGGKSNAVRLLLEDVQQIQASSGAFAAVLGDGSVLTWGSPTPGRDSRVLQDSSA